jgi:hypothetical protein
VVPDKKCGIGHEEDCFDQGRSKQLSSHYHLISVSGFENCSFGTFARDISTEFESQELCEGRFRSFRDESTVSNVVDRIRFHLVFMRTRNYMLWTEFGAD